MEHISDELKRIDILINIQVTRFRQENKLMDGFQGIYISEEEVNSLINADDLPSVQEEDPPINILKDQLIELESNINQKTLKTLENGVELRISSLANIFDLSPFEVDCILICLAPALDRKYEKLYAYLNDDITKKHPTVDLVLNLLCSSTDDKIDSRKYFDPSASLLKYHLIQFVGDETSNLLSQSIKLDERMVNYLLEIDHPDARIKSYIKKEVIPPDELILSEEIKNHIRSIIQLNSKKDKKSPYFRFMFTGPYGVGKKTVAQTICRDWKKQILIVDINTIVNDETDFTYIIQLLLREARLTNSAVYLEHFEQLFIEKMNKTYFDILSNSLEYYLPIVFIGSQVSIELDEKWQENLFKIEFNTPDDNIRQKIWIKYLDAEFDPENIRALANKFKFTPGKIKDAIKTAHKLAILDDRGELSIEDIYQGCKGQSNQKLEKLASKIKPNYQWDDLILPQEKKEHLKDIETHIKNKDIVYHQWGFADKLSLGKGLNILFSGPSGTGKTMAAEVMARELNLDLYKIDLSMVVSKYIGETEKNLSQIFKEAEESNALLFFDEADALFGKRSEVRDSHDRYANIEISYLLQKMEEHHGVVILATNLSHNMDDAFLRRIDYSLEFPFPEEEYRQQIWEAHIPENAPISDDVDFGYLARQFPVTGGNIKNIIVNSAFYAVENPGKIKMKHIIRATKREYEKIGKVCLEGDFKIN